MNKLIIGTKMLTHMYQAKIRVIICISERFSFITLAFRHDNDKMINPRCFEISKCFVRTVNFPAHHSGFDRCRFVYFSKMIVCHTEWIKGSNPGSSGHFGSRRQLAIIRLIATPANDFVIRCYFRVMDLPSSISSVLGPSGYGISLFHWTHG